MLFRFFGGKPVIPKTDFLEHALSTAEIQKPSGSVSFCVDGLNYIHSVIFDYVNVRTNKIDRKLNFPEVCQKFYPISYRNMENRLMFEENAAFVKDFYPEDDHIFHTRNYEEVCFSGTFSHVCAKLFGQLRKQSPESDMIIVMKKIDESTFSDQDIKYIITELDKSEKKDESDDMTCIILNYIEVTDFVMSQDLYSKLFTKRPKNKFKWRLYNFDGAEIKDKLRAKGINYVEEKGKIIIDLTESLYANLTAYLEGIRSTKIINVNPELNMDNLAHSIVKPRAEYFINPIFVSFSQEHHLNKNYEYYYAQRFVFYTLNKFAQLYRNNMEKPFEEFLRDLSGRNNEGKIICLMMLKYRDKMGEMEKILRG